MRGESSERSGPLSAAAPPPFPQGAPAASNNIVQCGKVGQFLEGSLFDVMIGFRLIYGRKRERLPEKDNG